jgi:hypothetical protein
MGQKCDCGWEPVPHLLPCLAAGVGCISTLSVLLGISSIVHPFESCESLTSQVSGAFLFLEVSCLHYFCWTSVLHSFSLTQYQIRFPSPIISMRFPHFLKIWAFNVMNLTLFLYPIGFAMLCFLSFFFLLYFYLDTIFIW